MNAVLLLFIFFLIVFLAIRSIGRWIPFLRGSVIMKVLLGYIAVLLVFSVIYIVTAKEEVAQADAEHYEQEIDQLYTSLFNGDIENIDEKYVKKTWKFDYTREEINMIQATGSSIFIEHTDELVDEIEVTFYQSPIIYKGMDIREKVMPPEVELLVDSLVVNEPEQVRIETATFMASLVEGQFTERESWFEHYPIFRTEVLYVRIPKGLKVIDDGNVHYISSK